VLTLVPARPTLAQESPPTYTVVPGDTLAEIAQRLGVTLDALVTANQIADPSLIRVGQVLVIPNADGTVPAAAVATVTRRARPGETPAGMAARLNVDSALLAALNDTPVDARFFPGQPVQVPTGAAGDDLYFGAVVAVDVPDAMTQGRTALLEIRTDRPLDLTVDWNGLAMPLTPVADDGQHLFTWLPAPALIAPGFYPLTVAYTTGRGVPVARTWWLTVAPGSYETQAIIVSDEKSDLLAPDLVTAELERVTNVWSVISPDLTLSGPFLRPVAAQWETSSPFGTRRAYGGGEVNGYHAGQDFAAPAGAEVRAPAAGVVAMAVPMDVRGNAILLDHGRGVFSGYWHLSEFKVTEGQIVAPGDLIGLVGTTGLSTGNHLHWELRINGVAVDPMQFLEQNMVPQ
jgi:murein DD-endopeptidase MepM/ murein hydrolase activator NlpD